MFLPQQSLPPRRTPRYMMVAPTLGPWSHYGPQRQRLLRQRRLSFGSLVLRFSCSSVLCLLSFFSLVLVFSFSLVILLLLLTVILSSCAFSSMPPWLSCSCVLLFSCPSLFLSSCFLVISTRPILDAIVHAPLFSCSPVVSFLVPL